MGLYASEPEVEWFGQQYAERGMKLDLGKSCVRFKRLDQVPLDVIGEVIEKVPPAAYIERYEAARARPRGRARSGSCGRVSLV
jgi:hypothetical protein